MMRNWLTGLLLPLLALPVYGQGITVGDGTTLADLTITATAAGVDACDDVADLVAWFDATTGVTTGATFTWADQSGNGNDVTQSTAVFQPSVTTSCQNSLDCIAFDDDIAEADFLSGTEWGIDMNTTGLTVFIVFDLLTQSSSDYLLGQEDGTGQGRTWVDLSADPFNLITYFGGGTHQGTTALSADTTYIATLAIGSGAAADVDIYVNGGSDEETDTDQGEASNGDMVVGSARDTTTSDPHNIMEICVYETVLGTTDREAVRDALNTKWSVY